MKKRTRILLISAIALIICALGLILYISHEPPEPTYNGKPLSFWLAGYDQYNYKLEHPNGPAPPTQLEANEAIRAMGTNAFSRISRMLQQHDSKFKTTLWGLLHRQNFIQIRSFRLNQDLVAFNAFISLAPIASNAVPELVHMYDSDQSPLVQEGVPAILGGIGPAARPAVPMLLRAATHTNEIVRNNAICALGQIQTDADKVVPALVKCLADPQVLVQKQAIKSLRWFGTDARSAFPALVERLRQEKANTSNNSPPNPTVVSGPGSPFRPGSSWAVSPSWSNLSSMYFDISTSDMVQVIQHALESIDWEAAKAVEKADAK